MTIRTTVRAFGIATLAILVLFFAAFWNHSTATNEIVAAYNSRLESYQFADGFRQLSADLTRLVRSYVSTGDALYKDEYLKILAIQDGRIATPVDYYTRSYWEFVTPENPKPRPDGDTVSLRDRMKLAGIQGSEFALLDEAIKRSTKLVEFETQAIQLMGQVPLTPENQKRAIQLVNSAEYQAHVASIMKPVDDFFVVLNQRTRAETDGAQASADLQTDIMLLMSVLLLLDLGFFGWIIVNRLVGGVTHLEDAMTKIADGDLEREIGFTGRKDEIGKMAASLEVFRLNALNKIELEKDAEKQKRQSEAERASNREVEISRANDMAQATTGLAEGLKHLAAGDLTFKLYEPFAAEFETLRHDFNGAVAQLADTLRTVAEATGGIDTGSREVSASADDLSRRTEQQAASLEETAAALEQITVNVANASKRVDEAQGLAALANESAAQSGRVVSNAVDAMQKIEQSSDQISNIIGVIDEIAFQTNLLALNAGVEAARAGEAGKGFAVVAQEVRELAQRSAKAAKEIKELICNSSGEVRNGVKLVGETGEALKIIEGYIVRVNEHMNAIATSAREQSVSLVEVNTAVNQMDQVTQQNAAMVEETNAAGAALASESGRLRRIISQFQLRKTHPLLVSIGADNLSHRGVPSPVRRLSEKLVQTFSGNAAVKESWEEF
jgi:methyl-accepting chemotaxis protein